MLVAISQQDADIQAAVDSFVATNRFEDAIRAFLTRRRVDGPIDEGAAAIARKAFARAENFRDGIEAYLAAAPGAQHLLAEFRQVRAETNRARKPWRY